MPDANFKSPVCVIKVTVMFGFRLLKVFDIIRYYMASSANGQDERNRACDWLSERARWSDLDRSGLPAESHKQNFPKSHIINPLLTKFVRSRWLDIGLVLFLRVYGPRLHLGP